jgi:hypothetical protein
MKLELTDSSCDRGDRVWQQEARCHGGAAGGWAPCSHSGTSRGLSSTTDRVQGEAPRSLTLKLGEMWNILPTFRVAREEE